MVSTINLVKHNFSTYHYDTIQGYLDNYNIIIEVDGGVISDFTIYITCNNIPLHITKSQFIPNLNTIHSTVLILY